MKKLKKQIKANKKTVKKKLSKPARKKVPYIQKGYHSITLTLLSMAVPMRFNFIKKHSEPKSFFEWTNQITKSAMLNLKSAMLK